jgi:hypothetical protein
MTTVFVTHPTQRLDQYFGPRATRELQAIADVRFNPHARELDTAELVAAAQDCDAVIAYRQTPAPAPCSPACRAWSPSCAARWTSAPSTSARPASTACW